MEGKEMFIPLYKCRICGKVFKGEPVETKRLALVCILDAICGRRNDFLGFEGRYCGHECKNGNLGIADFMGFRREKEGGENSKTEE